LILQNEASVVHIYQKIPYFKLRLNWIFLRWHI